MWIKWTLNEQKPEMQNKTKKEFIKLEQNKVREKPFS